MDGPRDGVPAPLALLADHGHPEVWAFAVPVFLAVGANRPVSQGTPARSFLSRWHEGIILLMASNEAIRAWAAGNGFEIASTGRIPGRVRQAYEAAHGGPAPIPGPDDDVDLGEIDLGDEWPEDGLPPRQAPPSGQWEQPELEEIPAAPPPGKLSPASGKGKAKGKRPTMAVQQDIAAKVGIMLTIPGTVWRARDPLCGGVFMDQEPEIASALTDLIMDSPDLVEWFTGTGGNFMKFFRLAAACMPVGSMIWAHHVVHSIEPPPADAQQPDYAQYAA